MAQIPTLVLTRPRVASAREAARYDGPVVIAPVMQIVGRDVDVALDGFLGVILTSANAVPFLPDLSDMPAYVVGARTAEASAATRGADVRLIAQDADDLVARLISSGDISGPLLHAHGRETRGEVAGRLSKAGIETVSTVIYDQEPCDLTDAAKRVLHGSAPVILPLWSPRSATLVAGQTGALPPNVVVIALSPAVAEAWRDGTGQTPVVCAAPTSEEMSHQIDAARVR